MEHRTIEFAADRVLVVTHRVHGRPAVTFRVEAARGPSWELFDEGRLTAEPSVTYVSPPGPGTLRCWYAIAGAPGEPFEITIDVRDETTAQVVFDGIVPDSGEEQRLLLLVERSSAPAFRNFMGRIPPELEKQLPKDAGAREVWFATNRTPIEDGGALVGFSGERDSGRVHYGAVHVRVPEAHGMGLLARWSRLLGRSEERLAITSIRSIAAGAYFGEIANAMNDEPREDRHAVVFIHGYNVSFRQAAVCAAQLDADLSLPGITAFFSWPSRGTLRGYLDDEGSVEAAERPITDYLIDIAARSEARHVHIVAHSMGNRALLRAVDRIARNARVEAGIRFRQIVLAAPDVDQDVFKGLCPAYGEVADRTTLYVSSRDRAVEASRWLHGFPRVGLDPPLVVASGIDTVNVTNVDVTLLGHGYVHECRDVLADMYALLREGNPPEARAGLRPATAGNGDRFWEMLTGHPRPGPAVP